MLFIRNIHMLRLELDAWIAHAQGKAASSIELMREAAELEASTPKHAVTPGPTIPAQELLGDLLFEQKRYREALGAYQGSLAAYPHRYNSVLGAARSARSVGDKAVAATFYRELLALGAAGTRRDDREEARAFFTP